MPTNPNFPIISTDYQGRQCVLRLGSGTSNNAIGVGRVVTSFRGEKYVVSGGAAPHKPRSSGRVYVRPFGSDSPEEIEFFPAVVDLVWVPVNEPATTQAHA
jgi:hypothetical protein